MGPCLGKKGRQIEIVQDFKQDASNQDNTIKPIFSNLYNILRKTKDLQIIREHDRPLFKNQTHPDVGSMKANNLKMLYNFKNIVWVGQPTHNLKIIQENTNPKQIYIISEIYADKFLKEFPIYSHANPSKYRTPQIPLLVFCSDELVKHHPTSLSIFLHSSSNKNDTLYKQLKIQETVFDTDKQAVMHLKKTHKNRVAYCHSKQVEQNELLRVLSEVIMSRYSTDQLATKIYLRRWLPHTQLIQSLNENISAVMPRTLQNQKPKQQLTIQQQQKILLSKLYKEMGSSQRTQKIERAHNLLVTLLSNIYTNKQSDSYRRVRKTNKQIDEMLGKYSAGVKLLKLNGFEDEGGFYVNKMEAKYLKIYRTDLDLAYRHLTEEMDIK